MPQLPNIIATKSPNGLVLLFDSASSKHSAHPADNTCMPEARLSGHSEEGYGLSWSLHEKGRLLSGADDELVCLWDIERRAGSDGTVSPLKTFKGHAGTVEVCPLRSACR
jgi:WD40 repeat protein